MISAGFLAARGWAARPGKGLNLARPVAASRLVPPGEPRRWGGGPSPREAGEPPLLGHPPPAAPFAVVRLAPAKPWALSAGALGRQPSRAGRFNPGSSRWWDMVWLWGCFGVSAPSDDSFLLLPPGLVRLHREHSHHRRAGDPASLQRHHQAGDSEETAWGGAALPQGPQPARRLDRGVQNPLPR